MKITINIEFDDSIMISSIAPEELSMAVAKKALVATRGLTRRDGQVECDYSYKTGNNSKTISATVTR